MKPIEKPVEKPVVQEEIVEEEEEEEVEEEEEKSPVKPQAPTSEKMQQLIKDHVKKIVRTDQNRYEGQRMILASIFDHPEHLLREKLP